MTTIPPGWHKVRIYHGGAIRVLRWLENITGHPFRIKLGTNTVALELVDTTSSDASAIRIYHNGQVKAIAWGDYFYFTDTLSISDIITKTFIQIYSEIIQISEKINYYGKKAISDLFSIKDYFVQRFRAIKSESIQISDLLSKTLERTLLELNSIGEKLKYWEKLLHQDILSLSDLLKGNLSGIKAEFLSVSDLITKNYLQIKTEKNNIFEDSIKNFKTTKLDSVQLTDYLTKNTISHLYDFFRDSDQGVNRWAYKGRDPDRPPDTWDLDTESEFTSAQYDLIESEDDSNYSYYTTASGHYAGHRFEWQIDESTVDITKIVIHWRGWGHMYYGGVEGAHLYIWDNNLNAWEEIGSHSEKVNTDIDKTITANIEKYITGGTLNLLAESKGEVTYSYNATISTDYVKVIIYK